MQTFSETLTRAESMHTDKPALVCNGHEQSFREFFDRCHRVGSILDELGVASGERVAILAANSDIYAELYAAIPSHGRSILPLNTRWSLAELTYAIKDGGAKILITDRDPGSLIHSVDHVLSTADYELMVNDAEPLPFVDVNEDDLAGLFYTGGTTGKSKGVM
ncbi:MAG TPA: AMP-dependent synthetase, partial [Acidimicrobiaceae bacterium]|nr:AMP-dependent synthetase [Acidimicrobiaceae bacterium]